MSDVREDLGYVPRERKPGRKPPTDREVVTSWPWFEGLSTDGSDAADSWMVTLRRKSGKRCWLYGQTEAEALARARRWIEGGGL